MVKIAGFALVALLSTGLIGTSSASPCGGWSHSGRRHCGRSFGHRRHRGNRGLTTLWDVYPTDLTRADAFIRRRNPFGLVSDILSLPIFSDSHGDAAAAAATSGGQGGYEISEDNEAVYLSLDVPGITAKDLEVQLVQDGTVLRIAGSRMVRRDGYRSSSRFEQRFRLNSRNMNMEKLSVSLERGVLTVRAPKLEAKKMLEEEPEEEEDAVTLPIREIADSEEAQGEESLSVEKALEEESESSVSAETTTTVDGLEITEEDVDVETTSSDDAPAEE